MNKVRGNMLRVLLTAPEISGLPMLAQTTELNRIHSVPGIVVTALIGPEVSKGGILAQTRWNKFDLWLWSGHGKDGHLLLPNDEEVEPRWLTSEAKGAGVTTVILAVCDSSQRRAGHEAFSDIMPENGINVIGMATDVGDKSAIAYDVAVLQSLAKGDNLRTAHHIGLESMGVRDAGAPQLYVADGNPSSLRDQVQEIQNTVMSGDNAEALRLARKFVVELESVQERQVSHGKRLTALERQVFPPWQVRIWQIASIAALVVAIVLSVVTETRDILYRPLWVGAIVDMALIISAVLLWQFGELTRERDQ